MPVEQGAALLERCGGASPWPSASLTRRILHAGYTAPVTLLSAVLITQNEEDKLADAMESVRFCDEIVVVDSGSDGPHARGRAGGRRPRARQRSLAGLRRPAQVAVRRGPPRLGPRPRRRRAGDSGPARGDRRAARPRLRPRRLPHPPRGLLPRPLGAGHGLVSGPAGPPLRPDAGAMGGRPRPRVGARARARWGVCTASSLHYPYADISDHLRKIDRYTTLWARQFFAAGRRTGPLDMASAGLWAFFRNYVLKRGFLLGTPGLTISTLNAYYTFVKLAKLRELAPGPPARPMRVLHVDTARTWRGGQNQVLLTALGQAARGHEVVVACRSGRGSRDARPGRGDRGAAAAVPRGPVAARGLGSGASAPRGASGRPAAPRPACRGKRLWRRRGSPGWPPWPPAASTSGCGAPSPGGSTDAASA